MNLNLGRQYLKTSVFALTLFLSCTGTAWADEPTLKPNILAVCHSLLTAAPDRVEEDILEAWREVQKYMGQQESSLISEDIAKGSKDLKNKRKIQLASIAKIKKLDEEFGDRRFQTEPTVRTASVIAGSNDILNYIKEQEDAEVAVQAEIDKMSPPLSLNNYGANLMTPGGLRKMILPTITTTALVSAIVGIAQSATTAHPVFQTHLDMFTGFLILAAGHRYIYRMGKAALALGVPSLRAEWEDSNLTRTDEVNSFFSNISYVLLGGNGGPFTPKHVSIRQPISPLLYEHCGNFMAGEYDETVKQAVIESLRMGNAILPKDHYFAVDMLFQYSNDEPTLTIVGRCR